MMPRRRTSIERHADLAFLENNLQRTLQPVGPRQSYVTHLRSRLAEAQLARRKRIQVFQYVLLSLAVVTGGAMFIIASVRAVLVILAFLGILRLHKEQMTTAD
jgi:hypothetical protein